LKRNAVSNGNAKSVRLFNYRSLQEHPATENLPRKNPKSLDGG
jgi:hypothetical protein